VDWELMLRHRAQHDDDFRKRHAYFLEKIRDLPDPWNLKHAESPPDFGNALITTADLGCNSKHKLRGFVCYQFRSKEYIRDDGQYDDFISIDFSPKRANYDLVARTVFPTYVRAFQCYVAMIENKQMSNNDSWKYEEANRTYSARNFNTRWTVIRINAINYFDRKLCWRAFWKSPERIVEKLKGHVEDVRILGDGVLLVYTYDFLQEDELAKVDRRVRTMLGPLPII